MQGASAQRLGVAALAIAALLGAAACTPTGSEPDAVDADPDPGPAEDPTDEPTDERDEALEALDTIGAQVAALRGLPIEDEIEAELIDPVELSELLAERDRDAEAIERLSASARVLAALRHVPPDSDLEAIVEELQSATVVGLYDAQDGVAYISSDEVPLEPGPATTAAHELVHALQDQHFDLTRFEDIPTDDGDAALAFLAVVEGDAVLVEEEWAATHQTEEERARAERDQLAGASRQLAVLDDVPSYVVETFAFPYVAGERFVAALIEEGGYDAVDAALDEPPTTTLEILDPEAYLEEFEAESVQAGAPPEDGFEEILSSSFGAFDLLALFGSASSDEGQAGAATWPAWRAGALTGWERDDELVVVGAWRFEGDDRADSACGALPAWYADVADGQQAGDEAWDGDRDTLVLDCEGAEIRFALAPDADLARAALELD